ncbi:MAG: AIM24 family protein [Anaerolineae bacterium]
MSEYSIEEFIKARAQDETAKSRFELENPHLLEINLEGLIWAKLGTMIGYVGEVQFTREGALEHGFSRFVKKAFSGEGTRLMKMEGKGRVYLADRGKKVQILNLAGETIHVNGNDLLAFEEGVEWDIIMMKRIAGMLAGGLFNVKLSGRGMVAITTHYDPLALKVRPGQPVFTDPNATVAWSGSLTPEIKTDVSLKTFLGRGSGESIQMKFEGEGWVVLQPFEEVYFQASQG